MSKYEILKINDEKLKRYARIVELDCSKILNVMSETPITGDISYVASVSSLESHALFHVFQESIYGGARIQIGYCNGNNYSLNAVEYHRCSEFILAATDLRVILGSRQDIDTVNYTYDTSKMEIFYVPAGTLLELYNSTLHFAPCNANLDGFRSMIVLPKGTGDPLQSKLSNTKEDSLLQGINKWIICHPETDMANQGMHPGLQGENITLD